MLNVERLAATALALHVGVIELEPFVEALADKIELSAIDVRQALGIDEHRDPMAFELEVFRQRLVGILELVGHARASGRSNAEPQPDALAPLLDVARHMPGRAFSEGDTHRDLHDSGCLLAGLRRHAMLARIIKMF